MEWFKALFFQEGVAQSVVVLAAVISLGLILSKIKIAKISFGITWILFAGIAFSHFGFGIDGNTLHFVKEFGLILFVYSIGLQVGPGFFSSFKKGGIKLNLLAMSIVVLGVLTTLALHFITKTPIQAMTGIMSGAITNTPGLGAAQQTYLDVNGVSDPSIAMGYAVAYPLGVLGIIFSILFIKSLFRVDISKELADSRKAKGKDQESTVKTTVKVRNPAIFGKSMAEIKKLLDRKFVVSRVSYPDGIIKIALADTIVQQGCDLLVVTSVKEKDVVVAFLGEEISKSDKDWDIGDLNVEPTRIIVTKDDINGKSLADLRLGRALGITVTRINRSGLDLVAEPDIKLQIGDRLTVVGTKDSIKAASDLLGNSSHKLFEPNLAAIFIGIALGIIAGSIPFFIPGIPQPVKLGLAGGPLVVAILMSRFAPMFKLVTYTTISANLMLREVGISLFLACVGLDAGGGFVDTILNKGGAIWILYGVIITVVPLLAVGLFARGVLKMNFLALMGLIAGSTTDPPALAYAGASAGNDVPALSYATVYPLTMFLRVLFAQLLILLF
ncbi:MAG: putative transporter [Bacteroidales bacterium]